MFAEKVIELLKEAERNPATIDPFNVSYLVSYVVNNNFVLIKLLFLQDDKIRQILEEMHALFKMNMNDA